MHGLLHDTEMLPITVHQLLCSCSPWWCRRPAAQLVTCRLLADHLDWSPSLTISCPLLKVSAHCNTVLPHGAVPPHTHMAASQWDVGSWLTFLPQETYGPYLSMIFTVHCPWQRPLTDTIVLQERNLSHPPYHILGEWSTALAPWHTQFWNG